MLNKGSKFIFPLPMNHSYVLDMKQYRSSVDLRATKTEIQAFEDFLKNYLDFDRRKM
jgi:hypothetical protein